MMQSLLKFVRNLSEFLSQVFLDPKNKLANDLGKNPWMPDSLI